MTRRKWGGRQYSSLRDYLTYDPLFREWWDICREARSYKMAIGNGYNNSNSNSNSNTPEHGISHANREMDQIGVLWVNTSQKGVKYLRGTLEDGRQFLAFANTNKVPDSSQPDWQVYVLRYTDDEKKVLAEYAAKQRAEREAKAAHYAAQRAGQGQGQGQGQAQAAPAAQPTTGGLPL